jgi:hypothetical protein
MVRGHPRNQRDCPRNPLPPMALAFHRRSASSSALPPVLIHHARGSGDGLWPAPRDARPDSQMPAPPPPPHIAGSQVFPCSGRPRATLPCSGRPRATRNRWRLGQGLQAIVERTGAGSRPTTQQTGEAASRRAAHRRRRPASSPMRSATRPGSHRRQSSRRRAPPHCRLQPKRRWPRNIWQVRKHHLDNSTIRLVV